MMASNEFRGRLADFWVQFIDPYGEEDTKLQPFSRGWNEGARESKAKNSTNTWRGVGKRFGAAFGEVGLEDKRKAWVWAKKRLWKYGWVEVEEYADLPKR